MEQTAELFIYRISSPQGGFQSVNAGAKISLEPGGYDMGSLIYKSYQAELLPGISTEMLPRTQVFILDDESFHSSMHLDPNKVLPEGMRHAGIFFPQEIKNESLL